MDRGDVRRQRRNEGNKADTIAMKRALHIFPTFSDGSGVQAFRLRHDPLARCIPPHVTLVFPFEDEVVDVELIRHIEDVAAAYGKFSIGFSVPIVVDGRSIWLPVRESAEIVADLQTKLYGGLMGKHLRPEIPYRPHVTLGVARNNDAAELLSEAQELKPAPAYLVESLILEKIGPGEESDTVATIPLS